MSMLRLSCALFLALAALANFARAGTNADTIFTERAKADFDTFLQLLNPYGTWSKIDGRWAYTPSDHGTPYTRGRWLYTEYGWYWKGTPPHSWATEHYGFWKRGADKVWSWFPGPFWLPETIEIRSTSTHIGWRSAEVDDSGGFVEQPIDRYTKPDEWSFVPLAGFGNPINPGVLAKPEVARVQLEASTDCRHSYLTYREIDRPGPHPADIAPFSRDGGMLAPKTIEDEVKARTTTAAPHPNSSAATNNPPTLLGSAADPGVDPAADTRQVKYWVTMSLPTFWTPPPADAKIDQLYLYRPDMYQDQDGIERRITLWFNPGARTALKDVFDRSPTAPEIPAGAGNSTPAVPAQPATTEAAPGSNPFSSPLDQPFHPGKTTGSPTGNHPTNAPPGAPAPSGLK